MSYICVLVHMCVCVCLPTSVKVCMLQTYTDTYKHNLTATEGTHYRQNVWENIKYITSWEYSLFDTWSRFKS